MDIRLKTFGDEVSARLDFLREDLGCAGPMVEHPGDVYPAVVRVHYRRHDLAVEVLLVLTYAGEEYVATRLSLGGSALREREIGSHTARTGYAMRRALDLQTDALRGALRDA
ncbi:hypothetical protein ACIQMR_01125 [Streptomyces sp. NPDC091376]|uniref:hypothetical protein n=1 Tax=Streptomyces sp. NPDC091376 TaxID=3365994 RepID=UPI003809A2F8